jgi:hypothetical protein
LTFFFAGKLAPDSFPATPMNMIWLTPLHHGRLTDILYDDFGSDIGEPELK